jgi:hypothetical protein
VPRARSKPSPAIASARANLDLCALESLRLDIHMQGSCQRGAKLVPKRPREGCRDSRTLRGSIWRNVGVGSEVAVSGMQRSDRIRDAVRRTAIASIMCFFQVFICRSASPIIDNCRRRRRGNLAEIFLVQANWAERWEGDYRAGGIFCGSRESFSPRRFSIMLWIVNKYVGAMGTMPRRSFRLSRVYSFCL